VIISLENTEEISGVWHKVIIERRGEDASLSSVKAK